MQDAGESPILSGVPRWVDERLFSSTSGADHYPPDHRALSLPPAKISLRYAGAIGACVRRASGVSELTPVGHRPWPLGVTLMETRETVKQTETDFKNEVPHETTS